MKEKILHTQLAPGQVGIFYLGQEGMLLKYEDRYLVIDPYLSDYVDRNCCDYVQWVRRYDAPIQAEELDFVDYVLCTHTHYDHADPDTLRILAKVNKKAIFFAPQPVTETLVSYGIEPSRIRGAISDETIALDGFSVTPIPSAHEELHADEHGNYLELGYKVTAGDLTVYHAGDCCLYDGLKERLMNVDVMMLPVNGRSYFKRYHQDIIGNMTAEEAVLLAQETKAGLLVPMHFDLYDVNCINPAHFVDTLFTLNPTQKFHIFMPGECYVAQK